MRNIAILRDGYSDFLVLKKLLQCIITKHKLEVLDDSCFLDLGTLNIVEPLKKYLNKASKTEDYSYHSEVANELIRELVAIYFGCYSRFTKELDVVTQKEIMIIYADSERLLMDRNNYFKDWAYSIKGLINLSIEIFYEKMVGIGYNFGSLPFIVPLILFPSSEILVATCTHHAHTEKLRELNPNPSLKQKVYGTDSIHDAIENGELVKALDTYLIDENLEEIYKEIPEARILMQSLTL